MYISKIRLIDHIKEFGNTRVTIALMERKSGEEIRFRHPLVEPHQDSVCIAKNYDEEEYTIAWAPRLGFIVCRYNYEYRDITVNRALDPQVERFRSDLAEASRNGDEVRNFVMTYAFDLGITN